MSEPRTMADRVEAWWMRGKNTMEIATILGIDEPTVDSMVAAMLNQRRAEAQRVPA